MQQSTLVEESFHFVQKNKATFTATFYQKLFEKSPQLKPLFQNTNMEKQADKLYSSLVLLVENIHNPEMLKAILIPLGEKHKGYGAIEQHYPLIGEVLIETLALSAGEAWSKEAEQAWLSTYQTVVEMMLTGMKAEEEDLEERIEESIEQKEKEQENKYRPTSKLTYLQKVKLRNKKNIWSRLNRWFWATPKWMIALYATLLFFCFTLIGQKVALIQLIIETLEPLSIFIAVLIFIKELPERKRQFHYQAWSIIDEATGIDNSQARIIALEDLCDDGVSLNGIDLEQAKLQNIEINGVVLTNANLKKTNLTNGEMFYANLSHSDLSESDCTGITLYRSNLGFVNLEKANCSSSNFGKANLMFANLSQGNFSGANFKEANLKGVNFKDAYLSGANFKGANVDLEELKKGYLVDAVMPNGKVFSA